MNNYLNGDHSYTSFSEYVKNRTLEDYLNTMLYVIDESFLELKLKLYYSVRQDFDLEPVTASACIATNTILHMYGAVPLTEKARLPNNIHALGRELLDRGDVNSKVTVDFVHLMYALDSARSGRFRSILMLYRDMPDPLKTMYGDTMPKIDKSKHVVGAPSSYTTEQTKKVLSEWLHNIDVYKKENII